MEPLGIGAIGSGEIAINSIFKHLVTGDDAYRCFMAAVCDPVPGRAEAMAKEYGIRKWYLTDDELLADPEVSVVSICSPIRFHYEQGMKAIRAGKHVHFNKTMAMTSAQATDLIETAKKMGVKIVVSPGQMAWSPNRLIRKCVLEKKVGQVTWAMAGVRGVLFYHLREDYRKKNYGSQPLVPEWYYKLPDGGPQYDHVPYALTPLTGVMGPAKRVTCLSGQIMKEFKFGEQVIHSEVDDNVMMLLDFGGGVFGFLYSALAGEPYGGMFPSVFGTEGRIANGVLNDKEQLFGDPKKGAPFTIAGVSPKQMKLPEMHVYGDLMSLVDYVRDGKQPIATAEHGRHVLEIIEAGFESARTGRTIDLHTTFTPLSLEELS